MSASQQLEQAAMQYAAEAVRLDRLGETEKAAEYYRRAVDALTRLIRLYPDYILNRVYIERVTTYKERLRILQEGGLEGQRLSFEKSSTKETISEAYEAGIRERPNVGWENVAGLQQAKKAIKEAVVYPAQRPDLFPLGWPRGILLFGPPGCGKTLLAAAVANEIDAEFIVVDAASVMSKWLGEAEKNVAKLFASARSISEQGRPAIIFIDEVDSLLGIRSHEVGGEVRVRNQFLKEMDGIMDKGKNYHLYVIAATNKPWDLDWAFIRRFQKRILVPIPDFESRIELFTMYTAHLELSPDVDLKELARATEGFTGSDIRDICQSVRMEVIRELFESGRAANKEARPRPVTMEDFKRILRIRKPSVSSEMIASYDRWFESFKAL